MSVQWAGNMRGPRSQTTAPRSVLLLLLLLLLSGLTRTVLCQDEDADPGADPEAEIPEEETQDPEVTEEEVVPEEDPTEPPENGFDATPFPAETEAPGTEQGGSGEELGSGRSLGVGIEVPDGATDGTFDTGATGLPPEDEELDLLLIAVPVALVVLLVAIVVCSVIICRRRNSKNNHCEMGKEDPYLDGSSTEKVPMPMFEEDVPSVLELEMDELDGWMKKDGEEAEFNQQL